MPLFKADPVMIAITVVKVNICTEHTRSQKMPIFEADLVTIALSSCNGKYIN